MSRNNSVYKEKFNECLRVLEKMEAGDVLRSEVELGGLLDVSRTTVRAILEHLNELKIIEWDGRKKTILRPPRSDDYFSETETVSTSAKVEDAFMQYVLGGDLAPGTILRESELAREFDVSSSAVREFMIRFSRFGLIEKRKNRHWVLYGFTRDFAMDLFDVRERFELWSFETMLEHLSDSNTQDQIVSLIDEHLELQQRVDRDYLEFSALDEKFHNMIAKHLNNRFVFDFHELVSLIFHFHYRWNKADEFERNKAAIQQHLDVLNALKSGDKQLARSTFLLHLKSARKTLLASVPWDSHAD